ncbi:DUF932 domain-containing protein [Virgibacillus sp. DJP39]|uniref:DUF932 domain-containing protein n=1 Tax=Virgibacillus sp. DJP39 TaxID=3409790 RepID=UPI003BB740F7
MENENQSENQSMGDRFNQILKKLEEEERKDIVIPLTDLRMEENGNLFSNEYGTLKVGVEALGNLSKEFGMNRQHLMLLMREGLNQNVANQFNHFLTKSDRNNVKKLRVVDGKIKGIVSKKYSEFNDYDLFQVLGGVKDDFTNTKLESFYRDDKRSHARFLFNDFEENMGMSKEGGLEKDIVKVGFDVFNSEIGYSTLKVIPITFRLICENGMMGWVQDKEKIFKTRHLGFEKNDMERKIREGIKISLEESQKTVKQMKKSKEIIIDNPFEYIEKISKSEGIAKKHMEGIKEAFKVENQNNLYGVTNSITRMGRDLERGSKHDNESRIKLEGIAGKLLQAI